MTDSPALALDVGTFAESPPANQTGRQTRCKSGSPPTSRQLGLPTPPRAAKFSVRESLAARVLERLAHAAQPPVLSQRLGVTRPWGRRI